MPPAPLPVLEAETVAATSAAVAALDLALESLAYSDARTAPTADQLGIGPPSATELHRHIVTALGSAPADELPPLSALLSVVTSVERITTHCAAIANLVPDVAPALHGDDETRRAIELAGVEARRRLVGARDALKSKGRSSSGSVRAGSAGPGAARRGVDSLAAAASHLPRGASAATVLPALVDHLGHVDDEAEEIAELAFAAGGAQAAISPSSAGARRSVRIGPGALASAAEE